MIRNPAACDRVSWGIVLSACAVHIVLGAAFASTHLPLSDEGFYGVPAHVLSVTGALRNPVLESAGVEYLRGIDQAFYWMAPMGMALQAEAFKLFGFGLLVQRGLSVFAGAGAVLFWYLALRRLVGDRLAALTAVVLAVDFVFLTLSALGRSDLISLFFSMAGLAAYMHWRERSLALALAVANTASAVSGMVHPNGGLAAVASLFVLVVHLDRRRLRWSHFAVVASCYGVLGLGWGLYIARAPDLFLAQFLGNVSGRLGGAITPTRLIAGEIGRYMSAYGLEDASGARLLRYLLPGAYLSAALFCGLSRRLRGQCGIVLTMFGSVSLTLILFEGAKQGWYLVHLSPIFSALLAIAADHLWGSRNIIRRMVTAGAVLIVLLGVGSLVYAASNRNLQRLYQPTVAFLNAHLGPDDVVFARSEFYFGLRCRSCLKDDANLGAFSGRRAEYIVLDSDYTAHLMKLRETSPVVYREIERRLRTEYEEVFRNSGYQVLRKAGSRL